MKMGIYTYLELRSWFVCYVIYAHREKMLF